MGVHENEVDFLEFPRKINTLLGMPFYVFSWNKLGDKFGAALRAFHVFFTEIIVIVVTIGQFWAIPHIYEDMNVLCGCLSSSAHCTQIIAKTFLLKKYKMRYLTHIKSVHSLQKEIDQFECSFLQRNSDFVNYHIKHSKYVKLIVVIQLLVNFVSTSAYFLPFVYDSIINRAEVRSQLTPIVVYISTDFNFTPLFQIIVVTLTVGFYVTNLKTVVIDNFILSLIVLHVTQLKYLNDLFKDVTERMIINRKLTDSNKLSNNEIKAWIKLHQAFSSVCNDFRNIISPYLFIEFSYIIIHTCVPAFVITSTFSWTLPQKVAVFCMVGGALVELFLMSSAGGDLSDAVSLYFFGLPGTNSNFIFLQKWPSISNDLFQSEFFENKHWMKHVFIIMERKTQMPFQLSAFSIIPLNRGSFASILRLIFSYYMTLNQIQSIKHYN